MTILRCQLLVLGDAHVGKSALTQRFHSQGRAYPKHYVMTLGVDFCIGVIPVPDTNVSVEMYIFDIGGQPMFEGTRDSCMKGANRIMLVFDLTNRESFNNCQSWLSAVEARIGKTKGVLVAMKADLKEYATVSTKEAQSFAQKAGLSYFECSALNNEGTLDPFSAISQSFYEEYETKREELSNE